MLTYLRRVDWLVVVSYLLVIAAIVVLAVRL